MTHAQYNLIYHENTDNGTPVSVTSFVHLEKARDAMMDAFQKSNRILDFPPSDPSALDYNEEDFATSISEFGIHVSMGLDTYDWEIEEIVPVDAMSDIRPAADDFSFWDHYEYTGRPLAFLSFKTVGEPLTDMQVLTLLAAFDNWYGNTDQDTTDYALEFQVLTRNLVCGLRLLVNPKYLLIQDCLDELKGYLNEAQYAFYAKALEFTQDDLTAMYKAAIK